MTLEQLREHLASVDTFGLDASKVEVVFETTVGNRLEFNRLGVDLEVSPKMKQVLTIKLRSASTGSGYMDR